MATVDTAQTVTLTHSEDAPPLGACIPRIVAVCRACHEVITCCHLSNSDIRAILRRGYRCPSCRGGD
jgi:hypothetical protein